MEIEFWREISGCVVGAVALAAPSGRALRCDGSIGGNGVEVVDAAAEQLLGGGIDGVGREGLKGTHARTAAPIKPSVATFAQWTRQFGDPGWLSSSNPLDSLSIDALSTSNISGVGSRTT